LAPPGGPYVHTIGVNATLQPRSMARPGVYRPAKSVATADGVATDKASVWFPVAQLAMNAAAASGGVGFNAAGRATVVVPPVEARPGSVVELEFEVDEVEAALGGGPCPSRC